MRRKSMDVMNDILKIPNACITMGLINSENTTVVFNSKLNQFVDLMAILIAPHSVVEL